MDSLRLEDLAVSVNDRPILTGVDLALQQGRIYALMGPNGSGKSTLALAVAGHPAYRVEGGRILLEGEEITHLPAHQRARRGLLLAHQYPPAVPGVRLAQLVRTARAGRGLPAGELEELLPAALRRLAAAELAERELNVGFSGGEKKRAELMQVVALRPQVALLDEPDSGVDVDALQVMAAAIRQLAAAGTSVLVITHYPRILDRLPLAEVFVLGGGRIKRRGGPEVARAIEAQGFGVKSR
ncbi:MAG: Fe-S cluster assembly ATPase SufC [Candidatus Bipolaricaulaceae bacterium]